MAKLQVSVSRMMSRRAAAISNASSNSESPRRTSSFESGADNDKQVDVKCLPVSRKFLADKLAIGRMHDVMNSGTDLFR